MNPQGAVDLVLTAALAEKGVREVGGQNRGPRVEEYLRRVHAKPGDPWCAGFVGFIGTEVLGEHWPLPKVPGTWTLHDFAKRHGILSKTPRRGSVFLLYSEKRKSWHTGFVVEVLADGSVATIEGNTNAAGEHDGDGVHEKIRRYGPVDRFIDWASALSR